MTFSTVALVGALITCEQEVTLRFRPPAPGTYAVLIFARHPDSRDGQTKIGPEGAGTKSYESVVEFRIVSRVKKNKVLVRALYVHFVLVHHNLLLIMRLSRFSV